MKGKRIWLFGAVIALCMICLCGGIFSLASQAAPSSPEAALADPVMDTQAPTPELTPTDTLAPEPTATPTLAPTPTVDHAARYATWMSIVAGDCQGALTDFSLLNTIAGEDVSRILDYDWQAKMGTALGELTVCAVRLGEGENVPPEFAEADRYLKLAGGELMLTVDNYITGLTNINPGQLETALNHYSQFDEYLNRALETLPGR